MGFEYLDHTADVKVRCTGKDFPEALTHAARAFTNVLTDVNVVKPSQQFAIKITQEKPERMLYALLEDLVYRKDTTGFVPCSAILQLKGNVLNGTLYGDSIANYTRSGDIKAVTLHELKVEQTETGSIELEFVLDI